MILTWLLCAIIFFQEEISFKPKKQFEVKLNYSFKQRPTPENTTFRFDAPEKDSRNQNSSNMLPYLELNVKILQALPEEVKVKVVSNLDSNVMTKKIESGYEFVVDMGFTDDVKDHVTANEYILYFLNDKREKQSKIVIFVDDNGTFLVNGEVRGKL